VEVRVHLYQRSFPEEPDRRVRTRREWTVDTAPDKDCALSDPKDRARFGRTNVKCIGGVSDPWRAGRGAKKGAANWGSLTPRLSLCSAATTVPTETGGTERRRLQTGRGSLARR
jgi:hypothetical protein